MLLSIKTAAQKTAVKRLPAALTAFAMTLWSRLGGPWIAFLTCVGSSSSHPMQSCLSSSEIEVKTGLNNVKE
uniref:Putative secreted protein n=1 Tax=Amblyomma triste TaxID=251400 RepID=A0A023G381_AMBTT